MFLSLPIIILIILCSIVVLLFVIVMLKLATMSWKLRTREANVDEEMVRNDLPHDNQRGLTSPTSGTSAIPSAPSTFIPSLPPHPPTYSQAIGVSFKDDTPMYYQ